MQSVPFAAHAEFPTEAEEAAAGALRSLGGASWASGSALSSEQRGVTGVPAAPLP